ncbi:MAG: Large-conductance mechanosensitive channel [Microgenomates bacterium OLB22]|nr:MAG: Large-conductance mechanosensitive channel [Microgenomates bacterium OLB22]
MDKIKETLKEKKPFTGFLDFIREQGVVGLAVGFILGGSITKVVTSLVNDLINPVLGLVLGAASQLSNQYMIIGTAKLKWGSFANTLIDFLIVAMVVYFGVKLIGLDRLDKKKEKK